MTNDYYTIFGYISELPMAQQDKIKSYIEKLEEFIKQDQAETMLAIAIIGSKYGEQ